jgi:hypothetical protein
LDVRLRGFESNWIGRLLKIRKLRPMSGAFGNAFYDLRATASRPGRCLPVPRVFTREMHPSWGGVSVSEDFAHKWQPAKSALGRPFFVDPRLRTRPPPPVFPGRKLPNTVTTRDEFETVREKPEAAKTAKAAENGHSYYEHLSYIGVLRKGADARRPDYCTARYAAE